MSDGTNDTEIFIDHRVYKVILALGEGCQELASAMSTSNDVRVISKLNDELVVYHDAIERLLFLYR